MRRLLMHSLHFNHRPHFGTEWTAISNPRTVLLKAYNQHSPTVLLTAAAHVL